MTFLLSNRYMHEILSEVASNFDSKGSGSYRDLEIVCGSPPNFSAPIRCHRIVLASVSPLIYKALKESHHEEEDLIFLPDFEAEVVQKMIITIYDGLKVRTESTLEQSVTFDRDLELFFGLNHPIQFQGQKQELVEQQSDVPPKIMDDDDNQFLMFESVTDETEIIEEEDLFGDIMLKLEPVVKIERMNLRNGKEIKGIRTNNKKRKRKSLSEEENDSFEDPDFDIEDILDDDHKEFSIAHSDSDSDSEFEVSENGTKEKKTRGPNKKKLKTVPQISTDDCDATKDRKKRGPYKKTLIKTAKKKSYYKKKSTKKVVPKIKKYLPKKRIVDIDQNLDVILKQKEKEPLSKTKLVQGHALDSEDEDEDTEPSLKSAYDFIESHSKDGVMKVKLEHDSLGQHHFNPRVYRKCEELAIERRAYYINLVNENKESWRFFLLGVKANQGEENSEKNPYYCKPFMSSEMEKKHILGQFDKVMNLIHRLYGLDKLSMYMGTKIFRRTHLNRRLNAVDRRVFLDHRKKKLLELEKAQVEIDQQISALSEKKARKATLDTKGRANLNLLLKSDLSFDDFEGVLFLAWNVETDQVLCHNINDIEDGDDWSILLFDIWGHKNKQLIFNKVLNRKFKEMLILSRTPAVLKNMVEKSHSGKDLMYNSDEEAKTEICEKCGEVFPMTTSLQQHRFFSHRQHHQEETKYDCDCNLEFAMKKDRIEHYKLVHMEGQESCKFCSYITRSEWLPSHVERQHKSFLCNDCGYTTMKLDRFNYHVLRHHTIVKCEQCDLPFTGSIELKNHDIEVHPVTFKCEDCKKVFPRKEALYKHRRVMHKRDEDQKFKCKLCSKGFTDMFRTKAHMINVHIRNRPFKCRYGCGMDYNDISNRNCHEKKKHGGLHPSRKSVKEEMAHIEILEGVCIPDSSKRVYTEDPLQF